MRGSGFRAGVSLHSHTLHSRESLKFLYRIAERWPAARKILQCGEARFQKICGYELDLTRVWWTPPLGPLDAWKLETDGIVSRGLEPFVSLTDHDDIEAPLTLRDLHNGLSAPVSVEWTLPHEGAEIHVGLHNLPADVSRDIMHLLREYTFQPSGSGPGYLLSWIASQAGTLVILNHPLWDEIGAGESRHYDAVQDLLRTCGRYIHALEWNGLRKMGENLRVTELAKQFSKPVISGGDRHCLEPNAVLNLTDASTFEEFVQEVRDGWSHVLLTERYFEPLRWRILQSLCDALDHHPSHARGWAGWSDRVFYRGRNGEVNSLTELWTRGIPFPLNPVIRTLQLAGRSGFRQGLRLQFAQEPRLLSFRPAVRSLPAQIRSLIANPIPEGSSSTPASSPHPTRTRRDSRRTDRRTHYRTVIPS